MAGRGAGGRGGSNGTGPLSFFKRLAISVLTTAFNEQYRRDINTEFQINREHRGGLQYNCKTDPSNTSHLVILVSKKRRSSIG